LEFQRYSYYDHAQHGLDFDSMLNDLQGVAEGDAVLLHGCCHNPCGADLSASQWQTIADLLLERKAMALIDVAYQGLGDDLDTDAVGLRLLARQLPEVLIAASCSKNFGLYRERTGATIVVTQTPKQTEIVLSQALGAARRLYSMPPAHGALIAGRVLASQELNELWRAELTEMTQRIQSLRSQLSLRLSAVTGQDFGFVAHEKGMFSFLGLTQTQVQVLRDTHAIHMLDSSRINVAGLTDQSIEPLALAIGTVIAQC
jgi:aspartate aminotransferase